LKGAKEDFSTASSKKDTVLGKRIQKYINMGSKIVEDDEEPSSQGSILGSTEAGFDVAIKLNKSTKRRNQKLICKVCGRKFVKKCNMMDHQRIHTGHKPYECTLCDKAFTQMGNLTKHMKQVHHVNRLDIEKEQGVEV